MDNNEWSKADFIVLMDEPHIAESNTGVTLHIGYDHDDEESAPPTCNFPGEPDVVCRLWKDHPGPHIPFARQLVAISGVYVKAIDG